MKKIKQFQCTKCPKHYCTKYGLKVHMNVSHEDVKRYQCYFCSFATFRNSNMIHHMLNHTKEKPYKCQYCLQSYKTERSVKKHKDGKSCNLRRTRPSLSPCYFCGKVSSTLQILKAHIKRVHLKEDLKRCNLCCKYFFSTSALNSHIRTVHLFERNYKCELCSKKLGSNETLYRHIRSVHTNEKLFKCYFCSKSFVTLANLRKHIFEHTKEKPLSCYFCRKDFSDPELCSVHIRNVHTKERPFKCTECPSLSYSSNNTLNAHVRRKHGTRVHQ
jgi:KRAB domain-containing zinc finger protein